MSGWSIVLAAMTVQAIVETETQEETEPQIETVEAMPKQSLKDVFKDICFDNFPTAEAVLAEIEAPGRALVKEEKTGFAATQPGDTWTTDKFSVMFMSADWLPSSIPSVQCSVSGILDVPTTHPESSAELAALLGLEKGKVGKDKPRSQSRWDIKDKQWRVFYSREPDGEQTRVRYSLLKLKK